MPQSQSSPTPVPEQPKKTSEQPTNSPTNSPKPSNSFQNAKQQSAKPQQQAQNSSQKKAPPPKPSSSSPPSTRKNPPQKQAQVSAKPTVLDEIKTEFTDLYKTAQEPQIISNGNGQNPSMSLTLRTPDLRFIFKALNYVGYF